jgi:hypothetical protein
MNKKTIPLEYANALIYEMEKAFWDERGKGARFRMTNIGSDYFKNRCLPLLDSPETDQILNNIEKVLQGDEIIDKMSYDREDRLLRIRVQGCIHRPVEDQMIAKGIEPFTCIPANLIALAIEKKLDRPVELAEIKVEQGACQLLLVVFDKRPILG